MALIATAVDRRLVIGTVVAGAVMAAPVRAAAQDDTPRRPDATPWFVTAATWGRWPTLVTAVGLTVAAITKKDDADGVYENLATLCREVPETCEVASDGTYVNPEPEALYQETLRLDAQARRWMIGGQAFLFVSGGLFLIDLVAGSSKPENIPYSPFEAYAAPGTLGLRWRF